MAVLRLGILGMGNAGSHHAGYLARGEIPEVRLAAVCDRSVDDRRLAAIRSTVGDGVPVFSDPDAFLSSDLFDAVLIATPHPAHRESAVRAFAAGKHVLVEKPVAVHVGEAQAMGEAARGSGRIYAAMFSLRDFPVYRRIKELITSGELGELRRVSWIATNWFRPQSYYDSGSWRATWAGEGGGVLINQAPHTLDLLQWLVGMPARLCAHCGFGVHHRIEVEDAVSALLEFPSGATGSFITSTGEAPGSNRLEIAGDRGKLLLEDQHLTFWRTRRGIRAFSDDPATPGFAEPEVWRIEIPAPGPEEYNRAAVRNFARAVLHGDPLLAPGEEGERSLQLSNAMLLSGWNGGSWIGLPVDAARFSAELDRRIAAGGGGGAKRPAGGAVLDLAQSFHRA